MGVTNHLLTGMILQIEGGLHLVVDPLDSRLSLGSRKYHLSTLGNTEKTSAISTNETGTPLKPRNPVA